MAKDKTQEVEKVARRRRTEINEGNEPISKNEKGSEPIVKAEPVHPQWLVIGGSITLTNRKTYNKGEKFRAPLEFILPAFRDLVELVTPTAADVAALEAKVVIKSPTFIKREIVATAEELEASDFEQLYEIVNEESDKVVSEEPLTESEADKFLKMLKK